MIIWYTSPLLRNFPTGSFSDGSTVYNFLRVKITLHCTLVTTLDVHSRRMSLAYFPLYWRNIMNVFSALSSLSSGLISGETMLDNVSRMMGSKKSGGYWLLFRITFPFSKLSCTFSQLLHDLKIRWTSPVTTARLYFWGAKAWKFMINPVELGLLYHVGDRFPSRFWIFMSNIGNEPSFLFPMWRLMSCAMSLYPVVSDQYCLSFGLLVHYTYTKKYSFDSPLII